MPKSKQEILEISPAFLEAERKYSLTTLRELRRIFAHVRNKTEVFVSASDHRFVQNMPDVCDLDFETPLEITHPRKRVYYDTYDFLAHRNEIEMRQEIKSYGVKQVIKIGDKATQKQPTLVRPEYPSKLSSEGINLKAISNKKDKSRIKDILKKRTLYPLITILSQRARLSYYPYGNKDIEIELGFDQLCGQTCDGHAWPGFQLEMEIKTGATHIEDINQIMNEQEKELFSHGTLDLVRDLNSKPTKGYEHFEAKHNPESLKSFLNS